MGEGRRRCYDLTMYGIHLSIQNRGAGERDFSGSTNRA